MIIKMGKRHYKLKKRILYIEHAYVILRMYKYVLINIDSKQMLEFMSSEKDIVGRPTYISLQDGEGISIHPIPDNKYTLEIVGSVIIVQ